MIQNEVGEFERRVREKSIFSGKIPIFPA